MSYTWNDKVKIFEEPKYGEKYKCFVREYRSKNIFDVYLYAVDGGDYLWETIDGDEIANNWDVIAWVPFNKILLANI